MPLPSDPELVQACLQGEESAWSALVARYSDLVHGLARRAGLSDAAAADAVQEVFLALVKSLPRLARADRLLPWIVKTARRQAWKSARRARAAARRDRTASREERDPRRLPDAEVSAMEDEQHVREALAGLGDACRRLLRVLYFETPPAPYDEVAKRLGMPRGSIGPTRRRCLEKLKDALVTRGFAIDVSGPGGSASSTMTPNP